MTSSTMRVWSAITLITAVGLAIIALFILENKGLARILFAAVLLIGYGSLLVRWQMEKRRRSS